MNLLKKEGGTQKGEGFPQKREGSNPGGNYGRKNFAKFLIKIFFSEIHFMNQRSNVYWKWCTWCTGGEHKRRNEWKFKKHTDEKKYRHLKQKKQKKQDKL